jgi:large subunit ribosomal protein L11
MILKLLVDGGEMKPGPAIAQKLGPAGINIGQVISEVNKATAEFKGTKVPVTLDVDTKTKKFKIEVSSPPTAELLKKEIGVETGSGDHKKSKIGNISIETVIKVAKVKHSGMLAKDFKSAVKSVVGSAVSLGILVENKGKEIEEDIASGAYDNEIKAQKTDTSDAKKVELKKFFEKVLSDQEAAKKAEEAAKAAEEAAKLAAAAAAPAAAAASSADAAKAGEAAKAATGEATKTAQAAGAAKAPAAAGKAAPAKKK